MNPDRIGIDTQISTPAGIRYEPGRQDPQQPIAISIKAP